MKSAPYFYTWLYIFILAGILMPLFFVLSTRFLASAPSVDVVQVPLEASQVPTYQEQVAKISGENFSPNIGMARTDNTVHEVIFRGSGLSKNIITIRQGDTLAIKNLSVDPIIITGKNWGSGGEVPFKKSFAQTFDFMGEYPFTVDGVGGVVIVK